MQRGRSVLFIPGTRIGFPGGSVVKNPPANAGDSGLISRSERSPGEGNGNPPQYSCLENPMHRGAWRATVHGGHKELGMTEQPELQQIRTLIFLAKHIICISGGRTCLSLRLVQLVCTRCSGYWILDGLLWGRWQPLGHIHAFQSSDSKQNLINGCIDMSSINLVF